MLDLKNTAPSEDRIFIRIKTDKDGRVLIDDRLLASRARDSQSGNLHRLSDIASSSRRVELNTSSSSFAVAQSNGPTIIFNFGINTPLTGITLLDGSLSTMPGATQVYVDPSVSGQLTAKTVAHELAHAWLFLRDKSPGHELLPGSEAESHFDPFYPYQ